MRPLGPDLACAAPDHAHAAAPLEGPEIKFDLMDKGVLEIGALAGAGIVHTSVVKKQRGIEAAFAFLVEPDGIGPRSLGPPGGHHEIAAAIDQSRDHIEAAASVAKRGRVDPARAAHPVEIELASAREHVADLAPVDEVAAVKDGNAGEVLEAAVHQIEVVAHPANAGIGMEAGQDGIVECATAARLSLTCHR